MTPVKQRLRDLTRRAIETAVQETDVQLKRIFETALEHLKVELSAGRHYAVVMSLREGTDYIVPPGNRDAACRPEWLEGVAAMVWKNCEVFNPTIERWDGISGGQKEPTAVHGYNIVLHWDNMDDLLARVDKLENAAAAERLREEIGKIQVVVAAKVEEIIAQLEKRAALQAKSGKTWAIVMSLKEGTDFDRPAGASLKDCRPEWLGGVAREVWDACADFNPSFESWRKVETDMRGEDSVYEGINIIIRWGA